MNFAIKIVFSSDTILRLIQDIFQNVLYEDLLSHLMSLRF